MIPVIDARTQRPPLAWGQVQPGMAFHHIIPFSLLRDVWNQLVDRHLELDQPAARQAIRQYLSLCDHDIGNIDSMVNRIKAAAARRRATHNPLTGLDYPEVMEVTAIAVWPSWNIVEGPANERRSDDPGNDYMDRFTAGLTAPELTRMANVEAFYERLQTFLTPPLPPSEAALHNFAVACSVVRLNLAGQGPIRFRPEMWVQEAALWRKAR